MTKTELKQNITKIKKFLKQRDYGNIDTGIELARALDEPAVFEALLGGWYIYEGELLFFPNYTGESLIKRWSDESWWYFAYALVNLIGYAPKNTKVDKSLEHANIKTLSLTYSSLQNVDGLTNLTTLTSLDLYYCDSLQNVDGLANCTISTAWSCMVVLISRT
jgi:Leucine-rich repeat (LRR) protein